MRIVAAGRDVTRAGYYSEVVRFDQSEFEIRCEWGLKGLSALAPISDVVVIVDVLSFSTAVDIGASQGGVILPYPLKNQSAADYARAAGAVLASRDRGSGFSLSPASLRHLPAGCRFVLPSPNGAALSFAVDHPVVLTACLRNAAATGQAAANLGKTVAVIPAGEMWDDGTLRPSLEDWLGAGAVITALSGTCSPEARLAALGFDRLRDCLGESLRHCSSGKELIDRGCGLDVDLAVELNVSSNVARLIDRAFCRVR